MLAAEKDKWLESKLISHTDLKDKNLHPPLSEEDVKRLLTEPSENVRNDVAAKVAKGFNARAFDAEETNIAEDIFRLLSRDKAVGVRKTLAATLKDNLELPRDVALTLARDVADVAVPILEYSYVLTEDDLIEIVCKTGESVKLLAVARRQSISKDLSHALLDHKNVDVADTLFRNGGASIAEDDIRATLEYADRNEVLLEGLVHRGGLSLALVERMFGMVPAELKHELSRKYKLRYISTEPMTDTAKEWAELSKVRVADKTVDMKRLVDQLYKKNKLTYVTAIRSLCRGDLRFFELIMAKLANIPVTNARILMLDRGALGFRSLYRACKMPLGMFEAVKTLLDVVLEETDYGRLQRADIRQRLVERIISDGYDQRIDHMPYLMAIIGKDVRHPHAFH